MQDTFDAINNLDKNGNPAGGYARGVGMSIDWQNGPREAALREKP